MIVNFYDLTHKPEQNCHGGEGTVKVARIFEKFETPIQFFHYTILPPGSSIGVHKHGDNEEFYTVLEGSGEMEVDGEKQAVSAGAVIKNKPFGTHGLKNTSDTEDLKILVFEVKR